MRSITYFRYFHACSFVHSTQIHSLRISLSSHIKHIFFPPGLTIMAVLVECPVPYLLCQLWAISCGLAKWKPQYPLQCWILFVCPSVAITVSPWNDSHSSQALRCCWDGRGDKVVLPTATRRINTSHNVLAKASWNHIAHIGYDGYENRCRTNLRSWVNWVPWPLDAFVMTRSLRLLILSFLGPLGPCQVIAKNLPGRTDWKTLGHFGILVRTGWGRFLLGAQTWHWALALSSYCGKHGISSIPS